MILRYMGCLAAIAPRQARALSLRTGIGVRRKYSLAETARALRVSIRRELQIERSAVAALTRADRHEHCAGGAHATAAAPAGVLLAGAPAFGSPQQASPAGATAVSAAFATRTEPRRASGKGGAPAVSGAALVPPLPHPGTGYLTLVAYLILALLLAAAVAALVRRWRSRMAPAGLPGGWGHPGKEVAASWGLGPPGSPAAIAAYRAADKRGDPAAASNLGVLLEQQGDVAGALAAYRRADERGDPNGALNLGCLLAERGDVPAAIAALRRADKRGDPTAASNLGALLEQQGNTYGALAAYLRADARGDAKGALNLGTLLARQGDLAGARDAFRRAGQRNDPQVSEQARTALRQLTRHIED